MTEEYGLTWRNGESVRRCLGADDGGVLFAELGDARRYASGLREAGRIGGVACYRVSGSSWRRWVARAEPWIPGEPLDVRPRGPWSVLVLSIAALGVPASEIAEACGCEVGVVRSESDPPIAAWDRAAALLAVAERAHKGACALHDGREGTQAVSSTRRGAGRTERKRDAGY